MNLLLLLTLKRTLFNMVSFSVFWPYVHFLYESYVTENPDFLKILWIKKYLEVVLEHCQSSHFVHCLHSMSKIALPILWMVNLPNTHGACLHSRSHFTKAYTFNRASCHIASNRMFCICSSLAQASKRVLKAQKQTKYRKKNYVSALPK